MTFSNSREKKEPHSDQMFASIKQNQTQQWGPVALGRLAQARRRKWRENRVCEVRVHRHDPDRLPARSMTSQDRKVNAEEQKLGKPEQPRAVGNSMIPVCPGFFLSDGSHQPHSD